MLKTSQASTEDKASYIQENIDTFMLVLRIIMLMHVLWTLRVVVLSSCTPKVIYKSDVFRGTSPHCRKLVLKKYVVYIFRE